MSKPTKYKLLIPQTAKECNISEEMTTDIVNYYYTALRKKMESLEAHSIGVPILGTFYVSKPKLTKSVNLLTYILEDNKPESFKKIKRYNLTTDMRDKQQKLLDNINKDEKERDYKKKNMGQ
jgi:hypothetical protein